MMENEVHEIPKGFRENKLGYLIPESKIPDVDLLRDEMVMRLFDEAEKARNQMLEAKKKIFSELQSFLRMAFADYNVEFGGKKGNVSFFSFDGRLRIQLAVATKMAFNEQLQVAKKLVDKCVLEWTKDASDNVKVLVTHAFETDKEGHISTEKVLALTRLDIKDDAWQRAMTAIFNSLEPCDNQTYIRFARRVGDTKKYETMPMDFSKLPFGVDDA